MRLIVFIQILILKTYASSLDVLKNDYSAAVMAVSGAKASVEEGVYAINYNPAGIAFSNKLEATISASNGFEDASYSYLATTFEIPYKVFSELSYPHSGFSIYLSNLGDITTRTLDNYGNIIEKNVNAEKDTILSFAYAEKLTDETVYLSPSMKSRFEGAAGITLKYINSTLLSKYTANSLAVDAGYLGRFTDAGISFGISVSNTLGKIKYYKEEYKLPQIIRAGISYSKPTILENKTTLLLEYDNYITDKKSSLKFGIDYTIENVFSFRLGYKFLEDNKGLSVGIGLYAGSFSFDISTAFTSVYKYSFFSVTYKIFKQNQIKEIKKSPQLDKFKEKQKEKTTPPPLPSKEKTIIVF